MDSAEATGSERTEQVTAWTPEAILQVHNVEQVRVSPNGRRTAFVVTDAVMTDDKSEFVSQIYLTDPDGGEPYPATFGESSARNPQWSPDGRWLAFTAKRGDKTNLFRLRLNGGEAEPLLTEIKSDVGEFRWSPDGRQIAYLMVDPKTEDEKKRNKAKDDWSYDDENIKYSRLYVVSVERDEKGKREPRLLTDEDYQIGGAIQPNPFDWSPDGKQIVFSHQKAPKADYWVTSQLSLVNVETGKATPLTSGLAAAMQPLFSPDGRTIACILTAAPATWAGRSRIHLIPAAGGEPRALPLTANESPAIVGWSTDGKKLYFAEFKGTGSVLSAMDIDSGTIAPLYAPDGIAWSFGLNPSRTHIGFTYQRSDTPIEAFVAPLADFTPMQVSAANKRIPDLSPGRTEILRWTAPDGLEIEGLLTYPVGYQTGERVPLVLEVHGGPAGVFLNTFTAAIGIYPAALFAANGFAVLRCNPRGSSGYGAEFRHANYQDWGGGDFQDLMAGVDHVIAQGVADPERLAVLGWSYGGFMTSWIITHTHRFKAASIGAAVTNLVSFTGTADIPSFLPDYFGGQFWEVPEIYAAHSPISHVKGVTTPALIQHCEGDIRVPISQGLEIYNALRQQNIPTRFLRMPRQTHAPTEPRMYRVIMESNLLWFKERLCENAE